MALLTRIASADQENPVPLPETVGMTLEQRREYTFLLEHNGESYLITEAQARQIHPLLADFAVGNSYMALTP